MASLFSVSPLLRGGDSGDVGKDGSPVGHRLCEPYQNSENRRFLRFSVKPLPWRGKGVGVKVETPHYRTRACSLATVGTQEGGVGVVEIPHLGGDRGLGDVPQRAHSVLGAGP